MFNILEINDKKQFKIYSNNYKMDENKIEHSHDIIYQGDYDFSFFNRGNGRIKVSVLVENQSKTLVKSVKFLKEGEFLKENFSVKKEEIPLVLNIIIEKIAIFYIFNFNILKETFHSEYTLFHQKKTSETQRPQSPQTQQTPYTPQTPQTPFTLQTPQTPQTPVQTLQINIQVASDKETSPNLIPNDDFKKIDLKQVQKEREIGFGSFGRVYLGYYKEKSNKIAIKEIQIKEKFKETEKEVEILQKLGSNPNIITYFGYERENDNLKIYMDYIPNTINKKSKMEKLDESLVQEYSKQILTGLKFIHENDIIHRDIKGSNILLDDKKEICYISDFGCSEKAIELLSKTEKKISGTLYYLAPELIRAEKELKYSKATDIYAFGCTVYEMLNNGNPPFSELNPVGFVVQRSNIKGIEKFPQGISEEAKSFLQDCLEEDPEKRKTIPELLNHSFILSNKYRIKERENIDGFTYSNIQRPTEISSIPLNIDLDNSIVNRIENVNENSIQGK